MEKKGDTPEKKEKGSSSKGPDKKKLGGLSPQQIDVKVLNVLCGVLEEWERAKVLSHYGKRITDASFVSSPLEIAKEKVPKSKVKLLKETPEKTNKKVTLKLEEVKKELKEWTPCSNQVQRSQSLTSADLFRSKAEVNKAEKIVPKAEEKSLEETPKKADGKETLKLKEEATSCNKQPQRSLPLKLENLFRSKAEVNKAEKIVPKAEEKSLEETPKKADGKETLKLKEETTSCNKQLQKSQPLKLEDLFRSKAEVNKAEKIVPKAEEKSLEETPKKADGKETLKLKGETTSCNKQLQKSQPLKLEDHSRSRKEVKELEVSDLEIKKHPEDVTVNKKKETLLKSQEGLTELSGLSKIISDQKVSVKKDREEKAQASLKQHPTTDLLSPSQPLFSSLNLTPAVYSPPSAVYSPPSAVYSPPSAVYSPPSPPPIAFSLPAPKVPDFTPKPSAPSGYVYVREHYRQGHEVQGHWRGDTWVNGYYRQGHTVSGHYRKK
ncbi:axoneme-associated protein mst101(2)-like [Macrobrachium rosenbergii]|uniref:axoneme-associated protein mst101(2)-like n=1 Tax=Macrobrachium rosenbergii TaxID=79674 RepID=UPI0034D6433C